VFAGTVLASPEQSGGVPDAISYPEDSGLMETFATSKARDRWFRDRVLGEVSSGQ
jgi:hypothetical protein